MNFASSSDVPTLSPGLTYLDCDDPRSGSLYHLALTTLAERGGHAYVVDARNTALTYRFFEHDHADALLGDIHLARAFTAYQHHTLLRDVLERAIAETTVIVLPCVGSLYGDDDLSSPEARALFDDVLSYLQVLSRDNRAVIVTAGTEPFSTRVDEHADTTVVARQTDFGTAFSTEGFETTLYHGPGYWQTTIPYWVELLGAQGRQELLEDAIHPTLPVVG